MLHIVLTFIANTAPVRIPVSSPRQIFSSIDTACMTHSRTKHVNDLTVILYLGNCALFLYRDVASKLLVRLADLKLFVDITGWWYFSNSVYLAQVSTSHILCSNLALTNVEPYFPDNWQIHRTCRRTALNSPSGYFLKSKCMLVSLLAKLANSGTNLPRPEHPFHFGTFVPASQTSVGLICHVHRVDWMEILSPHFLSKEVMCGSLTGISAKLVLRVAQTLWQCKHLSLCAAWQLRWNGPQAKHPRFFPACKVLLGVKGSVVVCKRVGCERWGVYFSAFSTKTREKFHLRSSFNIFTNERRCMSIFISIY